MDNAVPMKSLTIDETKYEIVDEAAREDIGDLQSALGETNTLQRHVVSGAFANAGITTSGVYQAGYTTRIATKEFIYVEDVSSLHYVVQNGYRVAFAFYNSPSENSFVSIRFWFAEESNIDVEAPYVRLCYASIGDSTAMTPSDSDKVRVSKNYELYETVTESKEHVNELSRLYYSHDFNITAKQVNVFFPFEAKQNDTFRLSWSGTAQIAVAFLDANGNNLGTTTQVSANGTASKIAVGDVATLKVYAGSFGTLNLYSTSSLYEQLLDDIANSDYYNTITQSDMTAGIIVQSNGVKAANGDYVSIENVPVIPSQVCRINAYFGGGADNSGGVSGWDANGNFKQRVFDGVINGNPTTDRTQYVDKEFTIPDGVFYIAFSSRTDGSVPIKLELKSVDDSANIAKSAVDMHNQLGSEFQSGTIFADEVKESIEAVQSVLSLSNAPMLTMAVFTDLHHDTKYVNNPTKDMMANIDAIYKRIHFDALMNLGDAIDGQFQTQYQAEGCLSEVVTDMYSITKRSHNLIGNHDDNVQSTWESRGGQPATEQLTLLEINDVLFKGSTHEVHNPDHITDYYVDYDEYGIRVICVGVNYTSYVAATQSWLSNTALQTDKAVLVFSHCATKPEWGYNNDISNGSYIENPLKDFVTGGGTVIALVHGHTHGDMIETDSSIPFKEVAIGCAKFETLTSGTTGITYQPRNANDETKILFDLVCVDQTNRKVHFIRCGAGADREISY